MAGKDHEADTCPPLQGTKAASYPEAWQQGLLQRCPKNTSFSFLGLLTRSRLCFFALAIAMISTRYTPGGTPRSTYRCTGDVYWQRSRAVPLRRHACACICCPAYRGAEQLKGARASMFLITWFLTSLHVYEFWIAKTVRSVGDLPLRGADERAALRKPTTRRSYRRDLL